MLSTKDKRTQTYIGVLNVQFSVSSLRARNVSEHFVSSMEIETVDMNRNDFFGNLIRISGTVYVCS